MNYLIVEDEEGGTAHLTTDSPASKDGIPVLRIVADDVSGDFTATDVILDPNNPFDMSLVTHAADVIGSWMLAPCRTPEELHAGELFLSQHPGYNYLECPAAKIKCGSADKE
ncbi:MAG: hypothetical protein HXX11_03515 [Desulfuromonadales bacterium]|nr:hypothetical protein [Desulfuromonadales bacterium]